MSVSCDNSEPEAAFQEKMLAADPLIYLVYAEGLSSVFNSQVVRPLFHRCQEGFEVYLGVFVPLGQIFRRRPRARWRKLCSEMPSEIRARFSMLPSAPTRLRWAWDDALLLRLWLLRKFGHYTRAILQCRGAGMTKMALKVRNRLPGVKVIFDCRGDEVAEFIGRHEVGEDQAKWALLLQKQYDTVVKLQRTAVCEADAICCVSNAMANELSARYGVPMSRFHVIPCCTDVELFRVDESHRARIRDMLGLRDRFVVTYCGSLEFYQLPDQAIRVFRIIRRIEPRAHFLAITTHPEKMRALAMSAGITSEEMSVLSLPPAEVPKYLVVSDVGLLLRHNDSINRVAAPVKFAEYLASGTPVIITEGIGDYSQAVAEHGLGVVVDIEWPDESLTDHLSEFCAIYHQHSQQFRERCFRYAKEHLSWTTQTNKVAKLYDELAHL